MLTSLVWRLICAHILGSHTRDWYSYDALGISRCLHCRKQMPTPDLPPRHRL